MNSEKLNFKLNDFHRSIITPDFLETVERWSRYQGEKLEVGSVFLEDMGTFTKVTKIPKLIWDKEGRFTLDPVKTKNHRTIYDVSLIRNISRCTNHSNIVIISERPGKYEDDKPRDLLIYSVTSGKGTTLHPTFHKLKKDFQSQAYKPYHSLLRNFCGVYSLMPYNANTDRIFNFTAIYSDLELLNYAYKDIAKSIKVLKRKPNKHKK